MGLRPTDFLVDDSTPSDQLFRPMFGRGLVPRDYTQDPPEMFDPPSAIKLIPRSEWSARIKELEERKALLSDVRMTGNAGEMIPNLDQGQNGYCWGHSTVHAVMMVRAVNNLPYVPLSAYAVCATIKKGVNEGGWCGLSAKFLRERGVPSQALWPQGDRNYQQHDKPEVWANAALHKVTEEWVDLSAGHVADQNLTFDQAMTCLLNGMPCALDYMWWAHSVCGLDPVEVEAGSYGIRILNSWLEWGDKGTGVLRGDKAKPDGALSIRVTGVSRT